MRIFCSTARGRCAHGGTTSSDRSTPPRYAREWLYRSQRAHGHPPPPPCGERARVRTHARARRSRRSTTPRSAPPGRHREGCTAASILEIDAAEQLTAQGLDVSRSSAAAIARADTPDHVIDAPVRRRGRHGRERRRELRDDAEPSSLTHEIVSHRRASSARKRWASRKMPDARSIATAAAARESVVQRLHFVDSSRTSDSSPRRRLLPRPPPRSRAAPPPSRPPPHAAPADARESPRHHAPTRPTPSGRSRHGTSRREFTRLLAAAATAAALLHHLVERSAGMNIVHPLREQHDLQRGREGAEHGARGGRRRRPSELSRDDASADIGAAVCAAANQL